LAILKCLNDSKLIMKFTKDVEIHWMGLSSFVHYILMNLTFTSLLKTCYLLEAWMHKYGWSIKV